MSVFPPTIVDLVERLTRYRDRLVADGRDRSAAIVDAEIADLCAEAAAEQRPEPRQMRD